MAPRPADSTRNSPRPLTAWRKSPSAIGLRQTLPVQRKRIVFIKKRVVKGGLPEGNRQCKSAAPDAGKWIFFLKKSAARRMQDRQRLEQIHRPRQRRVAQDGLRRLAAR